MSQIVLRAKSQTTTTTTEPNVLPVPSTRRTVAEFLAWSARLVLVGVLVAAPWAFGGAEYSDQSWIYSGVLVATALWLVSLLVEPSGPLGSRIVIPTLLVPAVAALLLGGLQLVRGLPEKWPLLDRLSQSIENDSAGEIPAGQLAPQLAAELTSRTQISLYPASTRLELARLTVGLMAFLAGVGLFWTPRTQAILWGALGLNGAALAFFGIAQKLSWNEKIYWQFPLTLGGQPFASYVNRNNAAGYLNLCFAAALGFGAWAFWKARPQFSRHLSDDWYPEPRQSWLSRLTQLEARHLLAVVMGVLILAGVLSSLSRGGVVATVVAGLLVLVFLAWRRGAATAAWVGLGAVLLSAGLMGWAGLSGKFNDRLSTLFDDEVGTDARWTNWQDAWRTVREFPVVGTGFGTYRYAYQPFQTQAANVWFYNADNHYVEGTTEAGLVGTILIAACVLLMLRAGGELLRRTDSSAGAPEALVLVGLFALGSQFVQACFDYGISVPANLLTFATVCGVIVGEAGRRCGPEARPLTLALPLWPPKFILAVLTVALMANAWLGVQEVSAAAVTKSTRSQVPELRAADSLDGAAVERTLRRLDAAVRQRRDDAELHQKIADVWIYRYRQQVFQSLQERFAAEKGSRAPDWSATDITALHRFANEAYRRADFLGVENLRKATPVHENLVPALAHLKAAQRACPVLPRIDLQLAMLAFLSEDHPAGLPSLERAVALTPTDPEVLYLAGQLAEQGGRTEIALGYWKRSLMFGSKRTGEILTAVMSKRPLAELIETVFPPSPEFLLDLTRTRFSGEKQAADRRLLLDQARKFLGEDDAGLSDVKRLALLAQAERLDGRPEEAIPLLQQVTSLAPDSVAWRMELAEAYRDAGRLEDAVREAKWCVWMAPDDQRVLRLQKELVQQQLRRPTSESRPNRDK